MGNKLEELRIAKSCLMWKCRSSTLFQRVGRAGQGRAGQTGLWIEQNDTRKYGLLF